MGKTFRSFEIWPTSVGYGSPHNRGFAHRLKKKHHHTLRNKNRNKDELDIDYKQDTKYKIKKSLKHRNPPSTYPIPNAYNKFCFFNKDSLKEIYSEELGYIRINWNEEKLNYEETLDKIIKESNIEPDIYHANLIKKQINRRGKSSIFKGHRK